MSPLACLRRIPLTALPQGARAGLRQRARTHSHSDSSDALTARRPVTDWLHPHGSGAQGR
jgi:hypothetical protein